MKLVACDRSYIMYQAVMCILQCIIIMRLFTTMVDNIKERKTQKNTIQYTNIYKVKSGNIYVSHKTVDAK